MTERLDLLTLPLEAADAISIDYLKRVLDWCVTDKPLLTYDDDISEIDRDIAALRRVLWYLTGDFSYDDKK